MIGNVILAFSSFSAGAVIGAYTSQHIKFNHERKNGFGNIYTLTVLSDTSTGSLPKTSNPNPNSAPKRGPKWGDVANNMCGVLRFVGSDQAELKQKMKQEHEEQRRVNTL